MEELIKNVILKYTMIKVENSEQNLLDLPVVERVLDICDNGIREYI